MVYDGSGPHVAHRLAAYPDGDPPELLQPWPACDPEMTGDVFVDLAAQDAAYLAVPCTACFPGAPPAGWRPSKAVASGVDGRQLAADPNLAWQLRRNDADIRS